MRPRVKPAAMAANRVAPSCVISGSRGLLSVEVRLLAGMSRREASGLVPPAALCIHLAIGQAYAFSVFNKPMSVLVGITDPAASDWKITDIGWIFSLAIVFLGLAAAFGGKWVEAVGPRKSMFAAALCFSGGLLIAGAVR